MRGRRQRWRFRCEGLPVDVGGHRGGRLPDHRLPREAADGLVGAATEVVLGQRRFLGGFDSEPVTGAGPERVTSVCAGAFVLAATGVLDGRRAATHWELAPDLALAFPGIRVESDPLFVRDGHVVTSAGVTAGIDLALSLVEEEWGAEVARSVARQLVVFMARPGGQAQFSTRLVPCQPQHPAVRRVLDHVSADPSAEHTLDSLAAVNGMSARHLGRLFRTEIGMSPGQYVESSRVEAAQALLERGGGTMEEVAQQAGFGSSESLRRIFQHTFGVSPTVYRARFRSTAGSRRIVAA